MPLSNPLRIFLLPVVLVLAATTPALGLGDLTGTYEGKLTCKGTLDGLGAEKFESTGDLRVTQDASDRLWISLPDVFGILSEVRYRGVIASSAKSESKGEIAFASCFTGFTANPADPISGEVGRAKASAKPASEKATLRGDARLFLHDTGTQGAVAEIYTCKLRYKRTATADPNVSGC